MTQNIEGRRTKDKFIKPATSNTLYSINSADRVEAFSNRFYVEETGKVYFARFQTTGAECEEIARNYLTVYPEVPFALVSTALINL